jgi:hypothetical protein
MLRLRLRDMWWNSRNKTTLPLLNDRDENWNHITQNELLE